MLPLRDKFSFQATVSREVQRLVDEQGLTYIEAVIEYAKTIDVEVEAVAEAIKKIPFLQSKIQEEGEDLNLLPKTDRLE
jgi:hypothetical protein